VLKSGQLDDVNSLNNPQNVAPKESQIPVPGKKMSLTLTPYSFNVVRIKMS
jgi:alpha-L-arabinofuranosidase